MYKRLQWVRPIVQMDNMRIPTKKKWNGKFHGRRPVERPLIKYQEGLLIAAIYLYKRIKYASRGQGCLEANY
jgi:hypothetical protein